MHETVGEVLKSLWSCFIHFIWDHFRPCFVIVGYLNVFALLVISSNWPHESAVHSWMTITPRPLYSLTSQWLRLKQIVEVTVISSAGLIRFIAGQILHANACEEIRYRSVMGKCKVRGLNSMGGATIGPGGHDTPPLSDAGGQGGHNLGIILISYFILI